jgi:hypothetical protein
MSQYSDGYSSGSMLVRNGENWQFSRLWYIQYFRGRSGFQENHKVSHLVSSAMAQ